MTDKKFTWIKVVAAAVIGALLAILLTECLGLTGSRGEAFMARRMGHEKLAVYIEKQQESVDAMNDLNEAYEAYCDKNNMNPREDSNMTVWMNKDTDNAAKLYATYKKAKEASVTAQDESLQKEFSSNASDLERAYTKASTGSAVLWSGVIALLIGLGMAVVLERRKTGKILLCTILSGVMGVLSGWFAQALYTGLIPEDSDSMLSLLIRGFGWGIMGIDIGLIFGLAAGDKKRILPKVLGGFVGAFAGGACFEFMTQIVTSNAMTARSTAVILTGVLLGIGVGLFTRHQDLGETKNP